MKRTIWKYDLEVTDEQTIQIPQGASVLTVDTQDGLPKLWMAVCPGEKKLPVRVAIIGTGNTLWCDGWTYAGSFKMRQDILVFHVFVEPVES